MAVRIYTLAKELKIDSKELVELCTRAGIQDKGSALASMSDEEVAKLREFIANRGKPAERPATGAPAVGAPQRPPLPRPATGPVTPAVPAASRGPAPVRREDYIAPTGAPSRSPPPGCRAYRRGRRMARPRSSSSLPPLPMRYAPFCRRI